MEFSHAKTLPPDWSTRAYELMKIASGSRTVEQTRAANAQKNKKSRENKARPPRDGQQPAANDDLDPNDDVIDGRGNSELAGAFSIVDPSILGPGRHSACCPRFFGAGGAQKNTGTPRTVAARACHAFATSLNFLDGLFG
jgi:hypothetical protein